MVVKRVLLALTVCLAALAASATGASIQSKAFGTTANGEPVTQYILTNNNGSSASLITYGATLTRLQVPDKSGKLGDVVLGFDNLKQYEEESPYLGATVGRVANRIAHGLFSIGNRQYALAINNGPNHLHGGFKGYDKRIWNAEANMTTNGPGVRFTLTDPDGDEGYPGTVKVTAIYSLSNDDMLEVQFFATSDQPTPINLTNHSYFNLKDAGKTDIGQHLLKVYAQHYTPVDDNLIPTGEIAPIKGTPIDFTSPKPIGRDLQAMGGKPVGYDQTLVLDNQDNQTLAKAAEVYEPDSGRLMEVWTTQPGMQFYTGNFLDGSVIGRGDFAYQQHCAFALETQHFPDSINHPSFPSSLLKPDMVYREITEFRFSAPGKAPW
jgi:aldose 1-epimerase